MWFKFIFFLGITILLNGVTSQTQDDCKCVSFPLCREDNGTIISDGEGLFNERFGSLCPSCSCTGGNICCSSSQPTIKAPSNKIKKCGISNPDGVGFKAGPSDSSEAVFGEYPWMIAIFENGKFRCGGSLLHPSVVLTAAHCVKLPATAYTVRAGEWDSGSTVETLKHQDRPVDTIIQHENFNPKNYQNDIALIFVKEPFISDEHIQPVCLIPPTTTVDTGRCYATGWGKNRFGVNGTLVPILKKLELPIVESKTCQNLLRKTRLGEHFILHESFLCAGGEKNVDTCEGDGGGPLVCPIDDQENRYQQVGITAVGIECNEENVPGVYVNIATFRDWIDNKIKDRKFDVEGYQPV